MRRLSDRQVLGTTVAELVGGRWAISLLAYAINAPLNLVSIATNADVRTDSSSWWQWAVLALIGYAALGVVLLLADVTAFRRRREHPVPVAAVAALGVVAGGTRGGVVGTLAYVWGIAPESTGLVLTRIVTGAALGAVMLPVSALALAMVATYRRQRSELVSSMRAAHIDVMRADGATEELQRVLLASVRDDLSRVAQSNDPSIAREVSHRIWHEQVVLPQTRMDWRALARASVAANPLATTPVAVIWSLSALGSLTAALGLSRALAQIAFSIAVIGVCFRLGRLVVRRHPQASTVVLVAVIVATTLLTGPVASALFDPRDGQAGRGLVVVNAIWLTFVILIVGFIDAAVRSGERVLAGLRAQIGTDEITVAAQRTEQDRLRRTLAAQMHSSVQSRLLAMAAFGGSAGVPMLDLDGLVDDPAGASMTDRLQVVAAEWAALMSVTLDVDFADEPGPQQGDVIVRIAAEALANAFRHGHARSASVAVRSAGSAVEIEVVDDGILGEPAGPGVGSAILDWLAPGTWTLTSTPAGTRLSVHLAA